MPIPDPFHEWASSRNTTPKLIQVPKYKKAIAAENTPPTIASSIHQ
jgi:hypothetical protein